MNVQTVVLDAWALLALLQNEEPAATRVKTLIERSQGEGGTLYVSIINLGEVFYRVGRERGAESAWEIIESLQRLGLTILSATDERVFAAAGYKMQHRISYADAFAAAAAAELGATIVTGDPNSSNFGGRYKSNLSHGINKGKGRFAHSYICLPLIANRCTFPLV